MGESDGLIEVLTEIRDEIRAVRAELGDRGARMAASGIRTEVVERGARWRIAATAGAGAVALVALALALRAGGPPSQAPVETALQGTPAPATTTATTTTAMTPPPVPLPAPAAMPALAPAAKPAATPLPALASKLAATRPPLAPPAGAPAIGVSAVAVPAVAVVPKRHVKPPVALKLPAEVASDEDEAMAFSPPPRRVRVHKMSYGPVDSEPAKL